MCVCEHCMRVRTMRVCVCVCGCMCIRAEAFAYRRASVHACVLYKCVCVCAEVRLCVRARDMHTRVYDSMYVNVFHMYMYVILRDVM